ncbi:MAG TPA: hypothetical protein VHL08_06265 [Dongiaceae bacterium]|jgi:hypothetical protein|nr:hypothetical protein [Dongiaceae bacterium]
MQIRTLLRKSWLAAAVSFAFLPIQVMAGQGFYVTVGTHTLNTPNNNSVQVANVNYSEWYLDQMVDGATIPFNQFSSTNVYTEHCAAFVSCGNAAGDSSFPHGGIVFSLSYNGATAATYCLSNGSEGSAVPQCGNTMATQDTFVISCMPQPGYVCGGTFGQNVNVGGNTQYRPIFVLDSAPQ